MAPQNGHRGGVARGGRQSGAGGEEMWRMEATVEAMWRLETACRGNRVTLSPVTVCLGSRKFSIKYYCIYFKRHVSERYG